MYQLWRVNTYPGDNQADDASSGPTPRVVRNLVQDQCPRLAKEARPTPVPYQLMLHFKVQGDLIFPLVLR